MEFFRLILTFGTTLGKSIALKDREMQKKLNTSENVTPK
jgi:hypothetical protein